MRGFTATELMKGRKDRDGELVNAFESLIRVVNGTPTRIEKERMMEEGLFESKMRGRFNEEFFNSASVVDNDKDEEESEDDEVDNFEDAVEVLDGT